MQLRIFRSLLILAASTLWCAAALAAPRPNIQERIDRLLVANGRLGLSIDTTSAGTLTLKTPSGPQTYQSGLVTLTGPLHVESTSGGGSLVKVGAGTLTLSSANGFNGATTISGGTLRVTSGSTTGIGFTVNGGAMNFTNGNVLSLDPPATNNPPGGGGLIINSGSNDGAGSITVNGSKSYSGSTTINSGTLNVSGSGSYTGGSISGSITSNGRLTYGGSGTIGTVNLIGSGTYTGGTTINTGTLSLAGSGTISRAGTITSGGTINIIPGTIDLSGGATILFRNGSSSGSVATLNLNSGTIGIGSILYDGGQSSGVGTYTGSLTINDSGASLVKRGAGTLTLGGVNSSTGTLAVSNGTLVINPVNALGAISLNSGPQLQYDIDGGSAANTIDIGALHSPIVLTSSGLTKLGAGTFTLVNGNLVSIGGSLIANQDNPINLTLGVSDPTISIVAIPEPSTFVLGGLAPGIAVVRTSAATLTRQPSHFLIAKAIDRVIVHHPDGLHVGVDDGWPHEFEAALL